MKSLKNRWSIVFATAFLGFLPSAVKAQIVQIDGSSTVFPVTEAVAEEFQKAKKGKVKVTVGIAGTGGGFKKFCRGETDISDASRPILKQEMEACKSAGVEYIELPVAFDALTVIVNPKNDWVTVHDRGRTQKNVGTRRAGKNHQLESSSRAMAQRAVETIRRRRGLRNLRLLHRSYHWQSQIQPRRFHGQRG